MKSILLVSAELSERQLVEGLLTAEGWGVVRVAERQAALRAAADRAPDLLIVDGRVAGAANLVEMFGLGGGGPGAIVLTSPELGVSAAVREAAEEVLARPVDAGSLLAAVRRILDSPRVPLPAVKASSEKRLTTAEIFGDVLRSVESGSTEWVDAARPAVTSSAAGPAAEPGPLFETTRIPPLVLDGLAPTIRKRPSPPGRQPSPPVAEDPPQEGRRFGQFRLLDRVAIGGMAEIWKADMEGMEGFRKTVAIKKILPHLTESEDFVTMFIDEAKLAAQLSHENILDIYDLGRIGEDYFIAMEYVEGRDLRGVLNAVHSRKARVPLGLTLLVSSKLARALAYAHLCRDSKGELLGLVHRDVSPRNVLISYAGTVKLCDFGVAKAATQVARTQIGTLKGKLQYMSPEQARGEQVDARSDIFSLGALLFEMTTGEGLFVADNEMSLLDAVRACRTREARQVEPGLPPEVNRIITRALQGSPARRYQSAAEIVEDLDILLRSMRPPPTEADLAAYLEELFPAEAPVTAQGAQTRVMRTSLFGRPAAEAQPRPLKAGRVQRAMRQPIAGILAVVTAGALVFTALAYLVFRLLGGSG